jgi:hypothetical protein
MDRCFDIRFLNEDDGRLFWFCGILKNDNNGRPVGCNLAAGILAMAINFYIWTCKLRKTSMSYSSLMIEVDDIMSKAFALSRKMRIQCKKLPFIYFRRWQNGQERGGRGEAGGGEDEGEEEA